jgi:hypothetical protein
MANLQPVDLRQVEEYWKSRGLVDERRMPYFIRWLQRFLVGPGGDARLQAQDAERAFVTRLEQNALPEWQVRQVARAAELFQRHYLQFLRETVGETGSASGRIANLPQVSEGES